MAGAKTKVASVRTQPATSPQGDGGDWGEANAAATAGEVAGSEIIAEAQPTEPVKTEATPVSATTVNPSEVVQQQISDRTRAAMPQNSQVPVQPQAVATSKFGEALENLGKSVTKAANHIELLDAVREAEQIPTENKWEAKQKAKAIALIKQRAFEVQQGISTVTMGANDIAAQINPTADRNARLALLAESNTELREILAENEALKGQVKQQEEQKD